MTVAVDPFATAENRHKEYLRLSPHRVDDQPTLFGAAS